MNIYCPYCLCNLDKILYKCHVNYFHHEKIITKVCKPYILNGVYTNCIFCDSKLKSIDGFINHYKSKHSEVYISDSNESCDYFEWKVIFELKKVPVREIVNYILASNLKEYGYYDFFKARLLHYPYTEIPTFPEINLILENYGKKLILKNQRVFLISIIQTENMDLLKMLGKEFMTYITDATLYEKIYIDDIKKKFCNIPDDYYDQNLINKAIIEIGIRDREVRQVENYFIIVPCGTVKELEETKPAMSFTKKLNTEKKYHNAYFNEKGNNGSLIFHQANGMYGYSDDEVKEMMGDIEDN